jgi:cation diffusion facilitator family transporter
MCSFGKGQGERIEGDLTNGMIQDSKASPGNDDPSRVALYSTILNFIVTGVKGGLAYLSGSSALLADTIHGLSDTFASLLVLSGIWLSKKKAENFPWGLYKVENFVALFSSALIFFAAFEIVHSAFREKAGLQLDNLLTSFWGLTGIIIGIGFFAYYEKKEARRLNSPSLRADASHWHSDIASTAIVFLALFGSWLGYPVIDRIGALVMVVFIGKAGWGILKDSMRTLLDASVAPETLEKIREVIRHFEQVREIKAIQARNAGRYIFVYARLVFKTKKFAQAHHLSEEIEKEIRKELPLVDRMVVHYEPEQKDFRILAIPVINDKRTLSEHFGEAPFFYLVRMRHPDKRILEEKILGNPYLHEEKGKGIKVSEWLLENGVDTVFTRKPFDGRGPSYVFSSSEVEVWVTNGKTVEEIQKEYAAVSTA